MFHHAPPDFVVFAEITQSQSRSGEGEGKRWMKGVTRINPGWLASLGKGLCTFSTPREMPGKGKSGNGIGIAAMGGKEDERDVVVVPHFRDLGVDLPAVRRKQRRKGTRWVLVE
jgi:ATP-dependent RNA helicase DHX37/DHR1